MFAMPLAAQNFEYEELMQQGHDGLRYSVLGIHGLDGLSRIFLFKRKKNEKKIEKYIFVTSLARYLYILIYV